MPFAAALRDSLQSRRTQASVELDSGESLASVLTKHLLTVEAMSGPDLITSILLLGRDGRRLSHGAGPKLPQSYCDAIDGSEIGPSAGSCGTAAYHGRPIYVSDIASDPLWADYRHIALPHGLRSCWSTPIFDSQASVIGTFAIYRPTVGFPTRDEIDAIGMITEHVAEAIMLARNVQDREQKSGRPWLRLVPSNGETPAAEDRYGRLLKLAETLDSKVPGLNRLAEAETPEAAEALRETGELSQKLAEAIRSRVQSRLRPRGRR